MSAFGTNDPTRRRPPSLTLPGGSIAIELEPDDYELAEILDELESVDLGDVLAGDLAQHGAAQLRDMTRGFELHARVNAIGVNTAERDALMRS